MKHRFLVSVSAAAVLVALVLFAAAPGIAQTRVPLTAWGKPDLQGIWDFRTITPLERPAKLANREFLTEEEAAILEQETVDKNREQDERPAERAEVSGGTVDRRPDGTPGHF